jgi:hypothetical protein
MLCSETEVDKEHRICGCVKGKIASSILASAMREIHNGKHSPMTSGGNKTRVINIGRFKPYKLRKKIEKWGKKRNEDPNGWQRFPNWRAKII